ncbi:unnamed protein product [Owenia fusiformis]|uniref:Alanine dehydrogenase/pyridine nucleotide transhydrogenase NAD(H)-binding domain-containing protein n=1 Tax=Owenia fusiformis TaxID=6347 RepID=A0A8S4NRH7_OWEFU|nr:unnamed protein product [Owenia fusiformis]
MAKQAIRDAGYEISLDMMPKSIGPLTFVFTGSGNVSQGAQEVFQELPHEYVEPKHLHKVAKHGSTNKLYVCVVRREDHLVHKEGKRFCPDEYDSHPERYVSTFSNKIAPHASVIINGIYWAPNSPRLISIPDAKNLLQPQSSPWLPQSEGCPHLPHKLLAICDISADPGGSMEFVRECTNIDSPFCLYDADDHMETESFKGNGVLVCSIDNMPTQIPRESTDFFGGLLLPYVSDMLKSDATSSFDEFDVSPVVKNAVIASNGKLTPNFEYINNLRRTSRSKHKAMKAVHEAEKRVLVLGSGFVAGPVIEYLTRDDKYHVTLVSDLKESADALANKFRNVEPMLLDTQRNKDEVEGLIKQHDLVISLLPYQLHADMAKICVKHKTNMVTASYCNPDMLRLNNAAIEAGITVVNEVGVDPGIDHMLAMECFDIARDAGGKVKSFVSYCGGLPAPEFSDNPLRYKFNWSPRGVLMNCLSGARYLKDGEVIDVPGEGHLLNVIEPKTFLPGFHLEGYPNRDSTIYGKLYDIESAHTIIRGTLRYRGFAEAAQALLDIGLLSLKAHPLLHPAGPDITWKDYLCNTFGTSMDILPDSLRELVFDRVDQEDIRMNCIEKLGLFEDTLIDKRHTPLDTLSNYLTKRLSYNAGERDLLIMRHEIDVEYPDGSLDREDINFVVYGDPNSYSAMAKTVGFPTGIAAKMVLEGEIQQKGMVLPLTRDIYRPILKRLKQEGIVANESKVMSNEAVPRVQAIV